MTAPFLDTFFDLPNPADELAGEIQEFANRNGIPDVLGLSTLTGVLRPAPNTQVRTTHGVTFRTKSGRAIGAIQTVSTPQARQVDVELQIGRRAFGQPAAVIGQGLTEHTIQIERLDLWRAPLHAALGPNPFVKLTDQYTGLRMREQWAGASGIILGATSRYDFVDCWLTSLGYDLGSTNDRISRGRCTLVWRDKIAIG